MIYLQYSRPGTPEIDLSTGANLVTIGSSPNNFVQITGEGIGTQHAQIDAANLRITELCKPTTAGLKINGEQTAMATLENGDIIGIGDWTIRFYHTGEEYVSERNIRTMKVESIHKR